MPLSDERIRNAKPGINSRGEKTEKPYKMGDSGGLYLEVTPSGGKLWRFKYRFDGKQKNLSLGVYPEVSLEDARRRRDDYRSLRSQGIDPSEHRKAEKAAETEKLRQIAETRFSLDNTGMLTLRLGKRHIVLSSEETTELRAFLDATRALVKGVSHALD